MHMPKDDLLACIILLERVVVVARGQEEDASPALEATSLVWIVRVVWILIINLSVVLFFLFSFELFENTC